MSRKKIGVLISGGGTNLQSLIDAIDNGEINAEVSIVISNKQKAFGLERAKKHSIKSVHISPSNFNDEDMYNKEVIAQLKDSKVDLVVLAGYLRILSPVFIKAFKNKVINIHPSLIPSFCGDGYYGEKVHEAVLEKGVKITGATTHFVDEGTDTGPIILQEHVPVMYDDDVKMLQQRVLKIEHKILVESVKLFCDDRLKINKSKVLIQNA